MTNRTNRRTTITVKKVFEARSTSKGDALDFTAEDGGRYSVAPWDGVLKPYIVEGKTLDVDITESPGPGGEWMNRNVTQVYVDGTPVKQKGKGGPSPQQIASEEARAAATLILTLDPSLLTEKARGKHTALVDKALDWCEAKIAGLPAQAPATAATHHVPPQRSPDTVDAEWDKLTRERSQQRSPGPGTSFRNAGDFWTRLYKELGLSQERGLEILEKTKASEVTDFDAAWKTIVAARAGTGKKGTSHA